MGINPRDGIIKNISEDVKNALDKVILEHRNHLDVISQCITEYLGIFCCYFARHPEAALRQAAVMLLSTDVVKTKESINASKEIHMGNPRIKIVQE